MASNNQSLLTLECSECKERNYRTVKNRRNVKERLRLNKHCPHCRKHTEHAETR